jgi:hypothetical protein
MPTTKTQKKKVTTLDAQNQTRTIEYDVSLKDFPDIASSSSSSAVVTTYGSAFFMCCMIIHLFTTLNAVVAEKELKLRAAMEMMGLRVRAMSNAISCKRSCRGLVERAADSGPNLCFLSSSAFGLLDQLVHLLQHDSFAVLDRHVRLWSGIWIPVLHKLQLGRHPDFLLPVWMLSCHHGILHYHTCPQSCRCRYPFLLEQNAHVAAAL